MSFYVVFTIIMGLVVLFKFEDRRFGFLLCMLLFFLSAFRGDGVGHDTINYMDYYYIKHRGTTLIDLNQFEITDFGSQIELFNNLLCKIVHDLSLNPRWLIVFYSLIMMLFLSLATKRYKISLTLVLAFYVLQGFYFESFNVARQFCAISVVFYAISFLKDSDTHISKFLLWIAVATFIHSFSAVCFSLYFIKKTPQISSYLIKLLYVLCLFLVILKVDIISNISILLSSDKITSYMDNYGGEETLNIVGILYNWIYISILYYFYVAYNKKCTVDKSISCIYILSLVVYSAFVNYGGIIGRINFYFSIVQIVILSNLFSKHAKKLNVMDKFALFIYLFMAYYGATRMTNMLESDYYLSVF